MDSIKIEILGSGCHKCRQLEMNAQQAIASLHLEAEVTHITDPIDIAKRGVLSTPALALNGKIVSKGMVMTSQEIQAILEA